MQRGGETGRPYGWSSIRRGGHGRTAGVSSQMPYLAYVLDVANGYVSCEIPLDDGLELSIR
jgi:hypothetical protein